VKAAGRPQTRLQWAATVVAVAVGLGLLVVFAQRMSFPLELEWMEGGVLHQALRLQRGEPIYPTPSADFVPFLYTPLYPALLAVLGSVLSLDFGLGRAISVLATVAIFAGLWRTVGREGRSVVYRVIAIGLFASGYVFAFRWLDLVRPDALYLALTLWGLVVLRESRGDHRKAIAAGVLMALAFWTKQTAASFILASGVGALLVAPRQLWSYALTIALIDGGGVLLGNAMTDGRLWHYIYELHQTHAFNDERFTTKTWGMFVHALPFDLAAIGVGLYAFVRRCLGSRGRRDAHKDSAGPSWLKRYGGVLFWALMAAAGLLVSAVGYSTQWAEPNAFLPGILFLALFAAVILPTEGRLAALGLGLVTAQMLFSVCVEPMYQPIQSDGWASGFLRSYAWQRIDRTVPSERAVRQAEALRAELEAAPGEVFALQRPWWSVIAGGSGHVGSMGFKDVRAEEAQQLRATIAERIAEGRYAQIWFEGEPPKWLRRSLGGYRVQERRHGLDRVRPMSGYMSEAGMVTPYRNDQVLWVPIGPRAPPPTGRVVADFEDGTLQGFETTGQAFGRRATRGFTSRLPAVGPYGGQYLLSSATGGGGLKARGEAMSAPFSLPAGGYVQMLLGTSGGSKGLTAEIVEVGGRGRRVMLDIPRTRYWLEPVSWEIDESWNGAQVQLRLADESPEAALWLDDLWIVELP
jgi:hypothetical protein